MDAYLKRLVNLKMCEERLLVSYASKLQIHIYIYIDININTYFLLLLLLLLLTHSRSNLRNHVPQLTQLQLSVTP